MNRLIAPPEPGYYPNINADLYHAWDCASNSRLGLLRRSPAHLKASLEEDFKETDALRFGRAAHMAILEPELFSVRYAAKSRCTGFTGKDERCKNKGSVLLESGNVVCGTHFKKDQPVNETVELVSEADFYAFREMRKRMAGKLRASGLIAGEGEFELSIVWDEEVVIVVNGSRVTVTVRCKARIDRYSVLDAGTLVDLKTTQDASEREFTRSIYTYGYHRQGGLYMRGVRKVGLPAQHYVIMAAEKKPPYEIAPYRLTEGALDAGEQLALALLKRYAYCQHTGEWPGYEDRIKDLGLPDWAWRKVDDELQELEG